MSTIKDVSRLSGISIGTVSRYLNGYKVKEVNQLKIEKAIKELGYKVNPMARGLKTNKTYTIGVLVPSVTDVFSNQVVEGMEEILDNENYSIIVCSSRNSLETEKEKISFLKEKRVDGIILMPVSDHSDHVKELLQEDIPLILIDRLLDGVECDAVVCDNVNGSYRAIEELIKYGHRRIGIIAGPSNVFTARERLNGYVRALQDYQIPLDDELIVYAKYEKGGGLDGYKKLFHLSDSPTAIFATNYETTMTGIKYMMEQGIKIGDNISLFGYDNTDVFQMLTPSIATVVQPMNEIGEQAAKLILKRIESDYELYPIVHRLKTKILSGASVKKLI
ncbi:LacI family DNA-binding transcriptional regulator [Bacillus sp. FJAT-49736]|uniref:LacI family DNA-binding transcriptional regulator n=1 Tax=Bacillus sp. FJAT-49736 TaxID=2833582 RepID=UPI001BCA59FF|nr:LacI family DNA-binding transcriptional regulator [Bacillus sp. FJAT-49736]MBS4174198.1 LacI family DNA-binding transcriptional regulator [Bacillus sp. FJAT-49736]